MAHASRLSIPPLLNVASLGRVTTRTRWFCVDRATLRVFRPKIELSAGFCASRCSSRKAGMTL
ncbi:hypothetical protein N9M16_01100 [Candidatus Dependentiae bacterium]|nr:hypothetical protein [Candidatus Dependentiae bacterium]